MGGGCGAYDFWVAPGSFDLESSPTFVEPSTPLIALDVFELDLFVAPDERSTSLRAGTRSGFEKERAWEKTIREWAGFAASSADPTRR